MLCHDKKRQRLKEYINYKLNKYYTVIFTLIIWDFFVFLVFIHLMLFQILTILHPTVLLPPMGLFHKPVNTKLRKPIVSYVLEKKNTKLSKLYYVCMKYENELKNRVGDVKPEEAATCKLLNFHFQPNLQDWNIYTLETVTNYLFSSSVILNIIKSVYH